MTGRRRPSAGRPAVPRLRRRRAARGGDPCVERVLLPQQGAGAAARRLRAAAGDLGATPPRRCGCWRAVREMGFPLCVAGVGAGFAAFDLIAGRSPTSSASTRDARGGHRRRAHADRRRPAAAALRARAGAHSSPPRCGDAERTPLREERRGAGERRGIARADTRLPSVASRSQGLRALRRRGRLRREARREFPLAGHAGVKIVTQLRPRRLDS